MTRLRIPWRSMGNHFVVGFSIGFFVSLILNDIVFHLESIPKRHHKIVQGILENKPYKPVSYNTPVTPLDNETDSNPDDSIFLPSNETFITTEAVITEATTITETTEKIETTSKSPISDGSPLKIQTEKVVVDARQNVTVLCWIMTKPGNHMWKAIHIKKTWGKRCTKLLFMSSKYDPKLPSIALPVKEGRNWLWGKTKEALKYIYAKHMHEADWFLKADDDCYVIIENLKDLLKDYNPNLPYLFGYEFSTNWLSYTYMSGGAGYVMSKEALKLFVEKALYMNDTKCYTSFHDGMEDIEVCN